MPSGRRSATISAGYGRSPLRGSLRLSLTALQCCRTGELEPGRRTLVNNKTRMRRVLLFTGAPLLQRLTNVCRSYLFNVGKSSGSDLPLPMPFRFAWQHRPGVLVRGVPTSKPSQMTPSHPTPSAPAGSYLVAQRVYGLALGYEDLRPWTGCWWTCSSSPMLSHRGRSGWIWMPRMIRCTVTRKAASSTATTAVT